MLLKEVLQKTTAFFTEKGFSSPRLDAELLLAHALKWDRIKLYTHYDYPMSEAELTSSRELVKRRAQGEPIAYILGSRDFYKAKFFVAPGVLIPRPETESLVEETVSWIKKNNLENPRIVDFGSGSGCIGLSILHDVPGANLLAVDISETAIAIAQKNAEAQGFTERAQFWRSSVDDLDQSVVEEKLEGFVDAVVANPPYISPDDQEVEANVKKYEPAEALFSTGDGLNHIRSWAKKAGDIVRSGGFVMFEIGCDQGPEARDIFEKLQCFDKIEVIKDLSKLDRFVRCQKRG
jgi:release factor glutamine methyltransferase